MSAVQAINSAPVRDSAEVVTAQILDDVQDALLAQRQQVVIGSAPAGGGKTTFIVAAVDRLARARRVVVITPTNRQVAELVDRLLSANVVVGLLHASGKGLPPTEGLEQSDDWLDLTQRMQAISKYRASVVVATTSKLGLSLASARRRAAAAADVEEDLDAEDLLVPLEDSKQTEDPRVPIDLLVVDEAYQVSAAQYLCVAGAAPVHLLVGDPGQLDPFTTLGDIDWWRGRAEDPLSTAVGAARRHLGAAVREHAFPLTRRLDERGAQVAVAFYPHLPFSAATPTGVRGFEMRPVPESHLQGLVGLGRTGWAYLRLPSRLDLDARSADRQVAETIADAVHAVLTKAHQVRDEREVKDGLEPADVLVGVSRNQQRLLVSRALARRGIPVDQPQEDSEHDQPPAGVRVLTANRAQGLQCEVSVVWHPLAGAAQVSDFAADPGRLCVLLTRHRQGCVVVGRDGDADLLSGPAPARPGYPEEEDRLMLGWYVHQDLFGRLADCTST